MIRRHYGLSALIVIVFVIVIFCPFRAMAEDVQLSISGKALERFFKAASPFKFDYELMAGQTAAAITISNPRVILEKGAPGHVWVELDYKGSSQLLGLDLFSGKARPEVLFKYNSTKGALRVSFKNFTVKAGDRMKIKLDNLLEPAYLPLTSPEAIQIGDNKIKAEVIKAATSVSSDALIIKVNYHFVDLPASN